MIKFKVTADVKNIYNNGCNKIETTYTANNLQAALIGFTEYLKSNKNIKTFKNIKIEK